MSERLTANVYISDGSEDDYWAEGQLAHIQVEKTDEDEVRIGVKLDIAVADAATLYFTRSDAERLCVLLAAASYAEVGVTL